MSGAYVGRADLMRMLAADPTGRLLESSAALAGYKRSTSLKDIGFVEICDERVRRATPGKLSFCEWLITTRCNFNCPYCNRIAETPENEPDMASVSRIVDILATMRCGYVQITGGEPTTRKDLLDIVSMLHGKGIRVGVSTNGSQSPAYYHELVDAGTSLFSFSLDVHRRDLNPHFTQMPPSMFDTVVENIRAMAKRVYTTVGIVLDKNNFDIHQKVIEFASSLGVADIRIMTATRYDLVRPMTVAEDVLTRHPILRFRVDNFNRGIDMRGSRLAKTSHCHLVKDDVTILGDKLYPCAVYAREGGRPLGSFDKNNEALRLEWQANHNSHGDPICLKYCMDFKCRYNDKFAEANEGTP